MFKKKPTEKTPLDDVLDELYAEIITTGGDTEEYAKMVDAAVKLESVRPQPDRISKEVLLTVGGNILAVILIVGHERAHVVTSKALTFVSKLR